MELRHALLSTLAGPLLAIAGPDGLRHVRILTEADTWPLLLSELARVPARDAAANGDGDGEPPGHPDEPILIEDRDHFNPLLQQLGEYFTGVRRRFELELAPRGTAFQQRVWARLQAIPYGTFRTYSQLAGELDEPRAARAVGQAAAQNPLPILIPCHRLLGTRGHLVGFAGGTDLKARLLRLEGHTLAAGRRVRPPRLF